MPVDPIGWNCFEKLKKDDCKERERTPGMSRRKCNMAVMAAAKMICRFRASVSFFLRRKTKILIVKDDGLGDVILWIPYGRLLRKKFPPEQYEITMLVQEHSRVICKLSECADRVVALPSKRSGLSWLFFRFRFWFSESFEHIYVVSAFQNDVVIPYGKSCIEFVMHKSTDNYVYDFQMYCNTVIKRDGKSIYQSYEDIITFFNVNEPVEHYNYLQLADFSADFILPEHYIAVCPGSTTLVRCWEEKKFSCLLDWMAEKYKLPILLVGSPREVEKCERIRIGSKNPDAIVNISGKTTTPQLFGVVSKAQFLVTNETGTAHIGAALRTETFILCGLGDYGTFVPYPQGREGFDVHCIFSKECKCVPCNWQRYNCKDSGIAARCISDISVEQVIQKIESQIKGGIENY